MFDAEVPSVRAEGQVRMVGPPPDGSLTQRTYDVGPNIGSYARAESSLLREQSIDN